MKLQELVKLIEEHADELADIIVRQIRESPRMAGYHRFGDDELAHRARLVYANLEQWLEKESEGRVEDEYFKLGKQRCQERVPLSQLLWALLLTRRNLWEFVESQGLDKMEDLKGTLDLEIRVVRFFDRAILHAVTGYESVMGGPVSQPHAEAVPFWPGG